MNKIIIELKERVKTEHIIKILDNTRTDERVGQAYWMVE